MWSEAAEALERMARAKGIALRLDFKPGLYSVHILSNDLPCYSYSDLSPLGAVAYAAWAELERCISASLILAINHKMFRANPDLWASARELVDRLDGILGDLGAGLAYQLFDHHISALLRILLERNWGMVLHRDETPEGFVVAAVPPAGEEARFPAAYSASGKNPASALARLALALIEEEEARLCPICGGAGRIEDIPCWRCTHG